MPGTGCSLQTFCLVSHIYKREIKGGESLPPSLSVIVSVELKQEDCTHNVA